MWSWLVRLYEDAAAGRLGPTSHPVFRWLVEAVHVAIVLFRETVRDRLHVRAAMLAYWSAVAIVPILLLGFAMTGPLGLKSGTVDAVKHVLYDTILASSVEDVGSAVDNFLASTNLGAFGILGVGGIMFIGAQLFFNVELAYNDIFRTRVRRSWFLRFTLFYAGITLAPLLIAAGFVISAQVVSGSTPWLSALLPLMLTTVLLVGAIRLLPGTAVSWRAALIGGLVSAMLFETMKFGFGVYTDILNTRNNMALIYGSLSLLPVFLLWMYVLWIIVLFGVELAYLVENHGTLVDMQRRIAVDPHARRRQADGFFALAVMATVSESFLTGRGAISAATIAQRTGADPRHVHLTLDVLEDAHLLIESEDGGYLPGQPPDRISASQVLHAWRTFAAPKVHGPAAGALRIASSAVDGALASNIESLAGVRHSPERAPPRGATTPHE